MPLYFFDFTDGEFSGRDQFGTKLPDVEAAAREAVGALANISKDVRKRYGDRVLALNVRSQSGETVLNVTLTLAAEGALVATAISGGGEIRQVLTMAKAS